MRKWFVRRALLVTAAVTVAVAFAVVACAPFVYAELWPRLNPHTVVSAKPVTLIKGRMFAVSDRFTPSRYEFLGMFDGLKAPSFLVSEWIKPGSTIDLGGRTVTVLSTPGHTAESIALSDPAAHRLFTGDFIYPTMLYAFLPGASMSAYRETTSKLLNTLPADTTLWAAHCCRQDEGYTAPWLSMSDLKDLARSLEQRELGQLKSDGFFPRRYPVNRQMTLGTGFSWNNR